MKRTNAGVLTTPLRGSTIADVEDVKVIQGREMPVF